MPICLEASKKPGVYYALTDDGVELPIVDVTHPAFALATTDAEQAALVAAFMSQGQPFARLPAAVRRLLMRVFLRGSVLAQAGKTEEALVDFNKAISLDPNDARAYLHLGETRLYLGQPEVGIPPLEKAIQLGPDDPNIAITYWALGTCQLLLGRVDQAIDLLQTARAADARLWVPYFYLAGAYGLQGDLDHARSALAESIRLKPAIKSLDRMRVENAWLNNPQYWALQEKTLNLGLRRAGLPDH